MKVRVSDASVAEYAVRVCRGDCTKDLFPTRMLDCEFTEQQREVIRKARADRRASLKNAKAELENGIESKHSATVAQSKVQNPKTMTKLAKMLYLQSGRCFFCGEVLHEEDASIEHLNPKSRGGKSAEDNEVVCHKSLNQSFGDMDLKRKFEFVLKSAGSFKCPKT